MVFDEDWCILNFRFFYSLLRNCLGSFLLSFSLRSSNEIMFSPIRHRTDSFMICRVQVDYFHLQLIGDRERCHYGHDTVLQQSLQNKSHRICNLYISASHTTPLDSTHKYPFSAAQTAHIDSSTPSPHPCDSVSPLPYPATARRTLVPATWGPRNGHKHYCPAMLLR